MSVPSRHELRELLEKVHFSKPEIDELFHPAPDHFQPQSNIQVRFPAFDDWLAGRPHPNVRNLHHLATGVRIYTKAKGDYEQDVMQQLSLLTKNLAGRALLAEIGRSGRRSVPRQVAIHPYHPKDHDDENASEEAVSNRNATCYLCKQRRKNGTPIPGRLKGTGDGSDSIVHYTASILGGNGAAAEPDDVLFHELVHASRDMAGVSEMRSVNQNYDNLEEYMAVVLTNIYVACKGRSKPLRASHLGHHRLPHPEKFLDNFQNVNLPPRELMERLISDQISFYVALYNIPRSAAWWNVARQYEEEERAQTLANTTGRPVKVKPIKPAPAPSQGNQQGIIDL